jgi:hypothetical protein
LLLKQGERQPCRRMRAGAKRAAGIDDDRLQAGGRFLPRRADPEASDDDTVMKAAPVVLPAVRDVVVGADVEALTQRACTRLVDIDGEPVAELLDALREEVEQLRELALAAGDDDASQRKALLIFFKKPSSGLYV